MSYSVSVNNSEISLAESMDKAREYVAGVSAQSGASAEVQEATTHHLEEQLGTVEKLIERMADLAGAADESIDRAFTVSASVYGHINPDGSCSFGVSGSIGRRVAAEG